MRPPSPTSRREFLRWGSLAVTGLVAGGWVPDGGAGRSRQTGQGRSSLPPDFLRSQDLSSRRPPPSERRFVSPAVEAFIDRVVRDVADPELAWLFSNCFPNTLDTTVELGTLDGRPDTFVITGDIPAMWLRDSSAQVWPYLPLMGEDPRLRELVQGVIHRQTHCILVDPYANAFNKEAAESPWKGDLTEMKPELHERKWEVDSLCYPIRLAHGYWRHTGDSSPFDSRWLEAMESVLRTFREQQRKDGPGPYKFQRVTPWQSDTVPGGGYGNPIRPVGLIVSIFRPSDDATVFPFLVPSNHFAVRALRLLAELLLYGLDPRRMHARARSLAAEAADLAGEVETALRGHAVVEHPVHGAVWAYEVDGFGNRLYMDDANIPSLLSLPYLGACDPHDPLYLRTRSFVSSPENPYFFRGGSAEGVGSPHVGMQMIWPLAIIMRALTATRDEEIRFCLAMLKRCHGGTGFMHESFHQDDPTRFTRPWFAWANSLFGELVAAVHRERPHLLAA